MQKKIAADTSAIKNSDPIAFIDGLYERQVHWNTNHYKSTTDKLLSLLSECLDAHEQIRKAEIKVRKEFFAKLAAAGFACRDGTHLAVKIVRYVFRIENSRAGAYARVLQIAIDEGKTSAELPGWVRGAGGIEAVRRSYRNGISPAQAAKTAADKAEQLLQVKPAILTIDTLPGSHPSNNGGTYDFSVALIRHNTSTNKADVVCTSTNATLVRQFLTSVSKDVIKADEKHATAASDSEKLAESQTLREAALAAATAAAAVAFDAASGLAA